MANITKKDMGMMVLAQMFGELDIMGTPTVKNNLSLIPRVFAKKKVRDYAEMSLGLAAIEENKLLALNAQIGQAISLMTARDRLELEVGRMDHEQTMMKQQELQGQANLKKTFKEIELLEMEVEAQKLDHKIKLKSLKEVLDDIEAEDRE